MGDNEINNENAAREAGERAGKMDAEGYLKRDPQQRTDNNPLQNSDKLNPFTNPKCAHAYTRGYMSGYNRAMMENPDNALKSTPINVDLRRLARSDASIAVNNLTNLKAIDEIKNYISSDSDSDKEKYAQSYIEAYKEFITKRMVKEGILVANNEVTDQQIADFIKFKKAEKNTRRDKSTLKTLKSDKQSNSNNIENNSNSSNNSKSNSNNNSSNNNNSSSSSSSNNNNNTNNNADLLYTFQYHLYHSLWEKLSEITKNQVNNNDDPDKKIHHKNKKRKKNPE